MNDRKIKKRDSLLLLLLLLLLIGGIAYYFGVVRRGESLTVNHPIDRPRLPESTPTLSDSSYNNDIPVDTAIKINKAISLNTDTGTHVASPASISINTNETTTTSEDVVPVKTEEIASDRFKKQEFINVSTDDGIVCLFDPVKRNLYFYPSASEWGKVYLIYPAPDPKSLLRRNLIYPDYSGLIYPVYRKGKVTYNGNVKDAVGVKINAKASKSRSYVIQAKSNPDYFIFGDYDNRDHWYIYEDGKVRRFVPPSSFDATLNDKL